MKLSVLYLYIFSEYFSLLAGMDPQEKNYGKLKGDEKDNRALVDDNRAQTLTGEDIDAMRRSVTIPFILKHLRLIFLEQNVLHGKDSLQFLLTWRVESLYLRFLPPLCTGDDDFFLCLVFCSFLP